MKKIIALLRGMFATKMIKKPSRIDEIIHLKEDSIGRRTLTINTGHLSEEQKENLVERLKENLKKKKDV